MRLFLIAFILTIAHPMGSITDLWEMMNAPDEERVRKEVALQRNYDNAVMAERREQCSDAAALYEKFLAMDPRHL